LSAVLDDAGVCRGICAMDLRSMEVKTFPADAVIFCTGGIGAIFGRSTNSVVCTGSAQSALFQQGVDYANGEFIQVHPTAIPGEDKLRLMSESARGEGGRVWVPRNRQTSVRQKPFRKATDFIFWRSGIRNTAISCRVISQRAQFTALCFRKSSDAGTAGGLSRCEPHSARDTRPQARRYLGDLRKIPWCGPARRADEGFPGMHYTMGGMWVNAEDQATNVPGIFAAGECEYQYHGANRLGANSLVSCIFGGGLSGPSAVKYAKNLDKGAEAMDTSVFARERKRQEAKNQELISREGGENLMVIWRELGDTMTEHVTVTRINKNLEAAHAKLLELRSGLAA